MDSKQFLWQDRFNIGVDIIDREHKKLFSIMNKLLSHSGNERKSQWAYQEGIKFFKGHAMKHFAEEEVYMASIEYSGFEMHRRLHDQFRKKMLPEIERELVQTGYSAEAVNHFLGVCAGWLIGHTLTEDRAITGGAISKWDGLLPEEEQAAMKGVVFELLDELFQLKPKVISESYGGEKFGNGIYYRLVYGSEKDAKWEFFLVFEEKLIVNTIGKLLGAESGQVDAMMLNATRYTARQFVERIKIHFSSAELLEVQEETLLTYEQFQRLFDKQSPQCSFLFDTGEGYFACCLMAPHLLSEQAGLSIKSDNVMSSINKYLKDNKENGKKKILVVDDSSVMRQMMKGLLEKDYEVTLVNSGLAAIRSMILDRPDLVLLDYEMPVCDGAQVLEMIRSEEGLSDIPVIFLTGTVDKERVQKIVPLKPAGYLLKTMQPEEIRKNVGEFFKKMKS